MKLLGISGSLSAHSKTALVVNKALEFAGSASKNIKPDFLSLSGLELDFCDGRNPDLYTGNTRQAIDKVSEADAYIIGSPIYRGSYSGAFKNLFDLIPNTVLKGKAVGIVATGGSYHHFLAIEHQLKPLLGYFNTYVVPGGVYAHNDHFGDGAITSREILNRLEKLGRETVRLAWELETTYDGPDLPQIERKSLIN
jgi:FMN reductase/FAD reductase [NAD(P)H]